MRNINPLRNLPARAQILTAVSATTAVIPSVCVAILVFAEAAEKRTRLGFFALSVVASVIFITVAFLIARRSAQREMELRRRAGKQGRELQKAQLDLCVEMQGHIEESSSEAQNAARSISIFEDNARSIAQTSEQMSANISGVATAAEEISANINSIAGTAEEISSSMGTVALTTEEMSSNLATVDTALREMSDSIGGIAENAREGAAVASHAAEAADETTGIVTLLGNSAEEIGKVTNVIQVIAQQTNLLALNAAIEAASAGEAGRGFAVVANEVKELARKTARATEDISGKIQDIQENVSLAVKAIRDITGIVNKIDDLQARISKMVDQQTLVTHEISRNVTETAAGVNEISKNIGESAEGANQVSRGIGEIATGANEVARNVAEAAAGISDMNKQIAEATTMIADASRFTMRSSEASTVTKQQMDDMLKAVEKVCDTVREWETPRLAPAVAAVEDRPALPWGR